ncbi:hypothetical protein WISP_94352 [Willisornis vidua]|uniref:Uncharacterized protein n=1 Tax=Willisornis vidua TaxID=1566151 RepID=A0ABQ9D606_9PASS|nr:hypothetical protein WISP_94352 [Willisornis vidua]
MLEQFMKNCSSWEEPMLKKFRKDCLQWESPHTGTAGEYEEEGGAKQYVMYGLQTHSPFRCAAEGAVKHWNKLPRKVAVSPSLEVFEKHVNVAFGDLLVVELVVLV